MDKARARMFGSDRTLGSTPGVMGGDPQDNVLLHSLMMAMETIESLLMCLLILTSPSLLIFVSTSWPFATYTVWQFL